MMLDTVLHLSYLNDQAACFVGDSSETEEVSTPFGKVENEYRYPSIQVSREMWEAAGRPVTISVKLSEYAGLRD
jgi:hypothetical protein